MPTASAKESPTPESIFEPQTTANTQNHDKGANLFLTYTTVTPNASPEATLKATLDASTASVINKAYFTALTLKLLSIFYPKYCPDCNLLMTGRVKTRPTVCRCPNGYKASSLIKNTPLHNLRLEMWTFSWILYEEYNRYPLPLTSMEIHRSLGIAYAHHRC